MFKIDGFLTAGPFFQVPPIVTQLEYLEQQHILILLKSTESDESYGESMALGREGEIERGKEGGGGGGRERAREGGVRRRRA